MKNDKYSSDKSMIVIISAVGTLLALLWKSSQVVNWIHGIFGQYQGIFMIDIYIMLGVVAVAWYAKYMNENQKKRVDDMYKETRSFVEESLKELHNKITLEYTSAINNHIEKISLMVTNTQEDIKEIKENVLSLTETLLNSKN